MLSTERPLVDLRKRLASLERVAQRLLQQRACPRRDPDLPGAAAAFASPRRRSTNKRELLRRPHEIDERLPTPSPPARPFALCRLLRLINLAACRLAAPRRSALRGAPCREWQRAARSGFLHYSQRARVQFLRATRTMRRLRMTIDDKLIIDNGCGAARRGAHWGYLQQTLLHSRLVALSTRLGMVPNGLINH